MMTKKIMPVFAIAALLIVATGCGGGDSVGVCEGYSPILNRTYCKDNFSASECAEWNELEVNGAEWNFHPGQTCDDR